MCISTMNKNKPQGVDDSIVVQVATPWIRVLIQRRFLSIPLNILSSFANPWTHGVFKLKAKGYEQWHH
jgi:hypothetical protein